MSPDPGSCEEEPRAFDVDNLPRALESCHRVYGMAREEGVRVAVGTEITHGAIAGEVRLHVECGWAPMEAVLAATKVGGERCALPDVGTLEPDKLTDLAALERVRLVMRDGVVQPVA